MNEELVTQARTNPESVDWHNIYMYQSTLSEDFIREFKNKVDWGYIIIYQTLSEEFIREFKDKVSWLLVSQCQNLSENFIREFKKSLSLDLVSQCQNLSEDFIREFKKSVNWNTLSACQKLSESFIREFKNKVNWEYISMYQKLSESFIREFKDKVNWRNISMYQKLSEPFIREFQDKVTRGYISKYQKLSESFIKEFGLYIPENNWLYASNELKKKAVVDCNLYELDGDYVVAYKRIRSNNYSKLGFQYKYEVGESYESHCDCNNDEKNSFGLNVWTLDEVKGYCNGKIIKVKIHISDIGALAHNCHVIRCFKFQVIEEVLQP